MLAIHKKIFLSISNTAYLLLFLWKQNTLTNANYNTDITVQKFEAANITFWNSLLIMT
jgi:hypothetical protein